MKNYINFSFPKVFCLLFLLLLSMTLSVSAGEVSLDIFHMTWLEGAQEVLDDAIASFEDNNPEVNIEQTIVSHGEAHSQFMISLTTGTAPDMAIMTGSWAAEFARMGAFVELDEYLSDDIYEMFDFERYSDITMINDKIFGVPSEGPVWGFFYRKDLFEEAGLDPDSPPENWDEMLEYAKVLTKDTNNDGEIDQWGIGMAAGEWEPGDYWYQLMWQMGIPLVEEQDGEWIATIDTPEGLEATQFYEDLVKEYHVMPREITGLDWEGIMLRFAEGDMAMMYNGSWAMGSLLDGYPELEGKWATAKNPAGPTGDRAALTNPKTWVVTEQSDYPELAYEFIEYFNSEHPDYPGQTYADRYAIEVGNMNFRKGFTELDYAQESLIKPFAESLDFGFTFPISPYFEEVRRGSINPGIQRMIMCEITAEEAVQIFQEEFERLH